MKKTLNLDSPIPKIIPDILRWIPAAWEEFVGNKGAVQTFKKLVKKNRLVLEGNVREDFTRPCLLLRGDSRSGKTAMVKFFIRCIACKSLDPITLNPCDGTCDSCKDKPERYGLEGIHAYFKTEGKGIPVHFAVVDCTMIHTPEQLRDKLASLYDYDGLRIYYFDEVHRLAHRGMDEMLLKAVEEKNFMWIFSSAKSGGLEDMFQNRLLKLKTELPSDEELAMWLVDRCEQWGINWQPEAVQRVVEKSNRIAGTALHALFLASMDPTEGLTCELVENEWDVELSK